MKYILSCLAILTLAACTHGVGNNADTDCYSYNACDCSGCPLRGGRPN